MNTYALQGAVIHSKEDGRLTFSRGKSCGHIRAPHVVDPAGDDAAIMDLGSGGASPAVGRQELVFPQQTQDPPFLSPEPGITQPGPHLAVSFAMKGGLSQDGFEVLHQVMISTWPSRSWSRDGPGWFRFEETLPMHRGAPQEPNTANPDQGIRFLRGGRGGPAHLLNLRRGKGRPSSRCSIFFLRSSFSMVTSPSFCCIRTISRSRGSGGRFFSTAWPAVRNCSRHFESRAALTPSSRESNSRSSPRNRRKTIIFHFAQIGVQRNCRPDQDQTKLTPQKRFSVPYIASLCLPSRRFNLIKIMLLRGRFWPEIGD
jgi:hypothetical protein